MRNGNDAAETTDDLFVCLSVCCSFVSFVCVFAVWYVVCYVVLCVVDTYDVVCECECKCACRFVCVSAGLSDGRGGMDKREKNILVRRGWLWVWSVECVFCMRWGNSSVVERWIPDPAVGGSIPSSLIFCTTEQPNAPSRAHHSRHSTLYARRLEAHSLCQRYVLLLVLTHAHTHTYKHGHTYTLGACMFVVCLFVCLFVRCIRCTDECMHLCTCVLACMCAKCGGSKSGILLDLCVSSLRRGHANLLCIVPILSDDHRSGPCSLPAASS